MAPNRQPPTSGDVPADAEGRAVPAAGDKAGGAAVGGVGVGDAAAGGAVRVVGSDAGHGGGVGGRVVGAGLSGLSHAVLVGQVREVVAERARLDARYLALVGELARRDGARSAAWQLREYTRTNGSQARSDAGLAEAIAEHGLRETLEALDAGQIQLSHVRVIAREAPKKHRRSEEDFLGLCRAYPSDVVARHPFAYRSAQMAADLAAEADAAAAAKTAPEPPDEELALQRDQRRCALRRGDDGMYHLHAAFDFITGRQISAQLAAAQRARRARPDADSGGEASFAQRNADALSDLILGRQTPQANLVIVADYDQTHARLRDARLDDGTPLSAAQLADLAADAKILPAMFNSDWSQLALGRARNANDAQRIVLAIRDGGCIACAAHSEHCDSHHIDHYDNGGLTDIPNLAQLCKPCHQDHHQRHWHIQTPPNGKPQRTPTPHTNTNNYPAGTNNRNDTNDSTRNGSSTHNRSTGTDPPIPTPTARTQ